MSLDHKSVYVANKFVNMGFFRVWKYMFKDLVFSLPLGWRLFVRDFRAKYQQQVFGVLWIFIGPIVAVLTYSLMAKASVLRIEGIEAPYPVYALLGFSFWFLLQSIITGESAIMNTSSVFIKQINFPKEALLLSPLLTALIDFILKMILFVIVCFLYGYTISPLHVLYVFTLIPGIFFALGLGMIFAIVGAVAKDVANFLIYFFQFLLLITPVMYPFPQGSFIGKIASYNPFYFLVVVPRDLVLSGNSADTSLYLVFSMIAFFIFFAGWRFYKVAMARIIEKV